MDYYHVTAFSDKPFSGNPAAVVLTQGKLTDVSYKRIAAEFNLSETAFIDVSGLDIAAIEDVDAILVFPLRWFTPTTEVSLCGHATLASAHVLFEHYNLKQDHIVFSTLSGHLTVTRQDDGGFAMRFPYNEPVSLPLDSLEIPVLAIIGTICGPDVKPLEVAYNSTTKKLIVRVDGVHSVLECAPSSSRLLDIDQSELPSDRKITGVSVTSKATDKAAEAFVSRYFAPWNGIPEDPVNGSSHTILGPYWAERLNLFRLTVITDTERWYDASLSAEQVSKRGGFLNLSVNRVTDTHGVVLPKSHVVIGGKACTVIIGKIKN